MNDYISNLRLTIILGVILKTFFYVFVMLTALLLMYLFYKILVVPAKRYEIIFGGFWMFMVRVRILVYTICIGVTCFMALICVKMYLPRSLVQQDYRLLNDGVYETLEVEAITKSIGGTVTDRSVRVRVVGSEETFNISIYGNPIQVGDRFIVVRTIHVKARYVVGRIDGTPL